MSQEMKGLVQVVFQILNGMSHVLYLPDVRVFDAVAGLYAGRVDTVPKIFFRIIVSPLRGLYDDIISNHHQSFDAIRLNNPKSPVVS
jgi:hypothetical protein